MWVPSVPGWQQDSAVRAERPRDSRPGVLVDVSFTTCFLPSELCSCPVYFSLGGLKGPVRGANVAATSGGRLKP